MMSLRKNNNYHDQHPMLCLVAMEKLVTINKLVKVKLKLIGRLIEVATRIGKYKEIQTKLLKREHKSRAEASALVARLASTIPKPAPSANFVTDGQTPTPIPIANSAPRGRTSAPTPTANSFACVNSAICVSAPTQAPNANSVASVRT